jgi:nicotinic acid mononucleotide adenylyltransferase
MNPLTCAHVALADAARRFARLDALCWVATLVTIDKESVERATLIDRLIEGQMHARASGEGLLLLSGGLYVEQARAAHALLEPEVEISLIVGYDKVVQIFDRRYYTDRDAALSELFAEAALIVAPRDGASEADLHTLLSAPENRPFADRVSYCPLPDRFARDSSSEARALASTGEIGGPLRDLLTPEGLALTVTAQPYEPPREPSTTSLGDRYTARQIILAALSRLDEPQLAVTPKLSDLVAWSAENSGRGAALRAWALDSASDNRGLRAALEMR